MKVCVNLNNRLTTLAGAIAITLASGASANPPASSLSLLRNAPPVGAAVVKDGSSGTQLHLNVHADIARYTVILKEEPVATYDGLVSGYPKISRNAANGRLDVKSKEAVNYANYLVDRQSQFLSAAGTQLKRPLNAIMQFQHAVNGVVVELTPAEAAELAKRDDVLLVDEEKLQPLMTDRSTFFIGADKIWDGSATGGLATQGEGIVIGDIDSGINFTSPSFASPGPIDGYVYSNPLGAGNYLGLCRPGGVDEGHCNSKLIGLYDFVYSICSAGNSCGTVGTWVDEPSATDSNGHGSHTASTAAGNHANVSLSGGNFTISGVAPHASIVAYDVCYTRVSDGSGLCPTTSTTNAANQAVADGIVDILTFSIGGGTSPWTDSTSLAFLGAQNAGIFVVAAAGNDGPAASTVSHVEPWVATAAASTDDQVFGYTFNLNGPGTPPANTLNLPARPGANPQPAGDLVNLPIAQSPGFANGNNDGCSAFASAHTFDRDVTASDRVFGDGFEGTALAPAYQKGIAVLHLDGNNSGCGSGVRRGNALNAGAAGVIFVDTAYLNLGASDTSYSMTFDEWNPVYAQISTDPANATASVLLPLKSYLTAQGDVVADFSSRGPNAGLSGQAIVKPEIAAPGVAILAAYMGDPGAVALEDGTSMSTPHIAGSAALLRSLHPEWTPTQIRSAMMMTAKTAGVVKQDNTPAGIWERGSGRIDLPNAAKASLVFDETGANFTAANPSAGGKISTLNLPSIADSNCVGACTYSRTVKGVHAGAVTYTLSVDGFPTGSATVAPTTLPVSTGGTKTFTVTVHGDQLTSGTYTLGQVTFTPSDPSVPVQHMPVAVKPGGPVIQVSANSVAASQDVNAGPTTKPLTITNIGNPTLNWSVASTGTAAVTLLNSASTSNGELGGYYNRAPGGSYLAQNFDVAGPVKITKLTANGFVLPSGSLTTTNTPGITFNVYADNSGVPAGSPGDPPTNNNGAAPVFTYTNTIGAATGITTTSGALNLNLTAAPVPALNLTAGRYWLVVAPNINSDTSNTTSNPLWAWRVSSDPVVGNSAQIIGSLFDLTDWENVEATPTMLSTIVSGTVDCTQPSWVSYAPTSDALGYNANTNVTVTFNPTGLTPGSYSGNLCISSNATNQATAVVALNFAVTGTVQTYKVTSSVATDPSWGTISPSGQQTVNSGATPQFTLNATSGYHIDTVGGTCGGNLVGSTFTTNAVMTDCSVIASFAQDAVVTHTVTPSVGTDPAWGTISPDTQQTVNDGATTQFTLTATGGYHIDTVGGTCGGSLSGSVFTTVAVTADCSVIASFAVDVPVTHMVTSSVATDPSWGTISPSGQQTVNDGATPQFTLNATGGYHISTVGGTCGGNLVGNLFTTNAVTADCSVIANFASDTVTTCGTGSAVEATASAGTAGPTGYTTLKAAFDAIDAGTHQGAIAVAICADTTETAPVVLNASGSGAALYTAITVNPAGGGARTVSGAIAAGSPLINFNGADNVTIDGLNSGGNALTLSNTTASGTAGTSTIRFIEGATNNVITNTTILGSATGATTAATGTVLFSTSTVAGGNSNNTVSSNDIGPAGVNLPAKAIQGLGTSAANANANNVISGNKIHDFFAAGASNAGISVYTFDTGWTISNNRIYQTAARTFTGTGLRYTGILIDASSTANGGNAFQITGNVIGFGAADGTGTTTISGSSNEFRGILLNGAGTGTPSAVQGNTISGIVQSSSRASTTTTSSVFIGIEGGGPTIDAPVNILNNTIGSLDGSSTIVINASSTTANTAPAVAIYDFNATTGLLVSDNNIGAITLNQSGGVGTLTGFRGILSATGTTISRTISNNTIGGPTAAGGIVDNLTGGVIYGIQVGSTTITATDNVVQNIINNCTTAGTVAVAGLLTSASTGANVISRNTIRSLVNNAGTINNSIYALYTSFATNSGSVVERNFVHSLVVNSTALTSQIAGILPVAGSGTYKNNMVRLGYDAAGNAITSGIVMYGMFEIAGTNNVYNNSVYIGGSGVASSSNTFAFVSNVTTGTRNYIDNIFWNARSNASGTATNAAGALSAATGATSNYNDLYADGVGGVAGPMAAGLDVNSIAVDPLFVAATGTAATVDLHVQGSSPAIGAGTPIATVTDDFDGDARSATAPTIGADERQANTPPTLQLSFYSKTHVNSGSSSTATLTLGNVNLSAASLTADLTDNLPSGVVVAATPNASTTCSGTVTANASETSFNLGSGAQIPAGGTCTVTVDVSSSTAGAYVNTIPAGALQTDKGNNANPASDNLVVAGAFPAPYPSETFGSGVEPISRVIFAGIDNSSTTSTSTSSANYMQNFTTTVAPGQVAPRGGYTISVRGNTDGNYTDYVSVYFDWNHDGVFNEDASEATQIGGITNSTGNATTSTPVTNLVIVPSTAKPGLTRMRVVKSYGSYGSASGEQGYGQTEDYLVLVDPSLVPPPTPALVAQGFSQNYLSAPGLTTTLTIAFTNYNAGPLALTADFTDSFPNGLVVAPTPNASTNCPSGTLTANAGDGSIKLASGAQIPSDIGCTISVDVTANTGGIYVNTIPAGAAQTANGGNPSPSSANVQFASTDGTPTYFTGFEASEGYTGTAGGTTLNGQLNWVGQGTNVVTTTNPKTGTQVARLSSTANGGTTGTQPLVLSPEFPEGASPYSVLSANVRISRTTNGATWELDPQDSPAGLVTTRLTFNRGSAASHTIQVVDFVAGVNIDTGVQWPADTYFNIKFIVNRASGAMTICKDGASIYEDPNGNGVAGVNITDLALLQVSATGQTANNTIYFDDVTIDNPATASCSGAVAPSVQTVTVDSSVAAVSSAVVNTHKVVKSDLTKINRMTAKPEN